MKKGQGRLVKVYLHPCCCFEKGYTSVQAIMSLLDPLQNRRMSSTRRRWVRFSLRANTNPVSSPILAASMRNRLRPSTTRRKMSGDRGHPYLKTILALKKWDFTPFMRTAKETKEMHPITPRMKDTSKPKWINNILTYNQLTLSYALDRSNFNTVPNIFLALRLWKASCATPIASCICLPCRKPNCSLEIFVESIAFSLLLITFEIIF